MEESGERRGTAVPPSPGDPGPLSRLLQELADASGEDALEAWKNGLHPGDRLGRFEIRREIGRGGFGAVYEAFDTELGRVVAVKTLRLARKRRELSLDWIKKEAEAVARLDHPCIVTLFEMGTCESGPYLVMELLHGKTLAQRIAEGPIPAAEALRIAEEMARGLAHAHQRGVLHRDLKPANTFLCEDGRVKLLDFGLANLLGTQAGSGGGTPAYMAPEQAAGASVDQRADVFAAGRVLGDMLGDRSPRRLARAVAAATSADPSLAPGTEPPGWRCSRPPRPASSGPPVSAGRPCSRARSRSWASWWPGSPPGISGGGNSPWTRTAGSRSPWPTSPTRPAIRTWTASPACSATPSSSPASCASSPAAACGTWRARRERRARSGWTSRWRA